MLYIPHDVCLLNILKLSCHTQCRLAFKDMHILHLVYTKHVFVCVFMCNIQIMFKHIKHFKNV